MVPTNSKIKLKNFVSAHLRASKAFHERITLYIPSKGRDPESTDWDIQIDLPDWDAWVWEAKDLLGVVNRGATALPPAEGFYLTKKKKTKVEEQTVLVYSFIYNRREFRRGLSQIREFLHRFGRDARQESVLLEFDGYSFAIDHPYDDPV